MATKYVRVKDRPRPTEHTGKSGWEYFHWRYGKRFYRGCRVRVTGNPGMDGWAGKTGRVVSCYTNISVVLDEWPFDSKPRKTRRFIFHPSDLEIILEEQA